MCWSVLYLRGVRSNYIKANEAGRFDIDARMVELQALGDPLQRLDAVLDGSLFEPVLAQLPKAQPKGPGGRPALHPLLMFKALVMAHLDNLSDAQMEFPITDRHSFKRFLGLSSSAGAPDEKTLWAFREQLPRHGLLAKAFAAFADALASGGLLARQGQIIEATFVEAPRQRNTRQENAPIKAGQTPADGAEQPAKARQKDGDARWTKKNDERHYGYKNHVKVDRQSQLIEAFTVTDAAGHDRDALAALVAPGDPVTYVDSA
jgi:IS5 family transposase